MRVYMYKYTRMRTHAQRAAAFATEALIFFRCEMHTDRYTCDGPRIVRKALTPDDLYTHTRSKVHAPAMG